MADPSKEAGSVPHCSVKNPQSLWKAAMESYYVPVKYGTYNRLGVTL